MQKAREFLFRLMDPITMEILIKIKRIQQKDCLLQKISNTAEDLRIISLKDMDDKRESIISSKVNIQMEIELKGS